MSEKGIDAYRVVSVLGYCLLPMVAVGALSVVVTLEYVSVLMVGQVKITFDVQQRHSGLFPLHAFHPLVHIRSIRYLRRRITDVGATVLACLPYRTSLRLLRAA